MKVINIIIAILCPVVSTATLSKDHVKSASSKFKRVTLKPSGETLTAVKGGLQHIRQCTEACVFTADCLTTVFDMDLGQCSLYNSSTVTKTLSHGETALMRDVTMNAVSCVALGYNQEVGGCVQMFTANKTYDEAETDCQKLHPRSHLVTITDQRKQLALNKMAETAGVTMYYTGGRAISLGSSTYYVWSTTGDAMTYTNWLPGEPNYHADCVFVQYSSGIFGWNDRPCGFLEPFICELD